MKKRLLLPAIQTINNIDNAVSVFALIKKPSKTVMDYKRHSIFDKMFVKMSWKKKRKAKYYARYRVDKNENGSEKGR